jgi:predicted nucleic acid-binding Zn ribbon protein
MTGKKRQKPQALGDVMKEVLRSSKVGDRIAQAHVIPEWRSLVGPQIANVTEPLSVTTQGTLFVAVTTNAWMNELSLLEPQLLKRLNAKTGRLPIRKIRWQIRRG